MTPPPLSLSCCLESMCVPSICQLLHLTLSACNVRGGVGAVSTGMEQEAQWETSSAFKLFLLFAWVSVGTMRHQMPQLVLPAIVLWHYAPSHPLANSPVLAMLLLIAIIPAVSGVQWKRGGKGGECKVAPLVWGRLCLVFRFNFGYMSTWSEEASAFCWWCNSCNYCCF